MSQHAASKSDNTNEPLKKKAKTMAYGRFATKHVQQATSDTHEKIQDEKTPANKEKSPLHFAIVDNGMDSLPDPSSDEQHAPSAPITKKIIEEDDGEDMLLNSDDADNEVEFNAKETKETPEEASTKEDTPTDDPNAGMTEETTEETTSLKEEQDEKALRTEEETKQPLKNKKDSENDLPSFSAKRLKPPVKSSSIMQTDEKEVDARIRSRLDENDGSTWSKIPPLAKYGFAAAAIIGTYVAFNYMVNSDDYLQAYQQQHEVTNTAAEGAPQGEEASQNQVAEGNTLKTLINRPADDTNGNVAQDTPSSAAQDEVKAIVEQSATPDPMDKWSAADAEKEKNTIDDDELYRLINRP